MKRIVTVIAGLGLTLTLAVGAAFASVPDGSGVLHGCYSANGAKAKGGTQLYIVDTAITVCSNGQAPVAWSQTGPQGIQGIPGLKGDTGSQGIQGIQGDPGVAGPAGSANGFSTTGIGGLINFDLVDGHGEIEVAHIDLPAGTYLVSGKVLVGNRVGANEDVECTLRYGLTGNIGLDQSGTRLGAGDTSDAFTTIPLTGALTLSDADTVRLRCATSSSDGWVNFGQLNAIQLASLNAAP